MAEEIIVGLFESKGIAEDACNRLRTEGVPDGHVALKVLHDIAPVPQAVEAELAALTVDPMIWGNVRDTYVSYIKNGETVVLVGAVDPDEAELAINVLSMFEPLVVEALVLQTIPAARSPATSAAE
ncbi:MAG TPA: hypothetical protein VHW66_13690 [Stellaceae bacterium]|jgi:hypothetical protein|nr:hypothetical protein [Stellaceae bacterium]